MDVAVPVGKHIVFAQVSGFGALFGPGWPGAGGTLLRTLRRWAARQPFVALLELVAAGVLKLLGPVRVFVDVVTEILPIPAQALEILPVEVGVAQIGPIHVEMLDVIAADVDVAVDVNVGLAMPAAATAAAPPARGCRAGDEPERRAGQKIPRAIAGIVNRRIAVGDGRGIVDGGRNIGRIDITRAIDHRAANNIGSGVARRIADIHHLRRRLVHPHIGHVVHGAAGRDLVNLRRHRSGSLIAAVRLAGLIPDRPIHGIVLILDLDHRQGGIDGVLQGSAFNGAEFGRAVVFNLGRSLAGNGGGDRNLGFGDRFLGLRSVRDKGQHMPFHRSQGYPVKTRGQLVGGDVGPRPVLQRGAAKPAPGQQHIELLIARRLKNVAPAVAEIEQINTLQGRELRRTIGNNQLSRFGCHYDLGNCLGFEARGLHLCWNFRLGDALSRRCNRHRWRLQFLPRALNLRSREPEAVTGQVILIVGGVEQQYEWGIHHPLDWKSLHIAQDRLTIHQHQH